MARTSSSARNVAKHNVGRKAPIQKQSGKIPHAPTTGGVKKPHRFRPGTVALREIKKYQKSTELLIRKMPFNRLLRDICSKQNANMRFQASAVLQIQESTEAFLIRLLERANRLAVGSKRITVFARDNQCVLDVQRLCHVI